MPIVGAYLSLYTESDTRPGVLCDSSRTKAVKEEVEQGNKHYGRSAAN